MNGQPMLSRPRLENKIKSGFTKRLTVVTGSSGIGKTALVKACIAGQNRQIYWINLDETDAALFELCHVFLSSILRVKPHYGEKIIRYLTLNTTSDSARNLGLLFSDAFREISDAIIVFDDFQKVMGNREVVDFFEAFVECQPSSVHLVLINRRSGFLKSLDRWRDNEWINEVDERDLIFTADETDLLLQLLNVTPSDGSMREQIKQITNGWVGLIIMLSQIIRNRENSRTMISNLDPVLDLKEVKQFIVTEVIHDLPPDYQQFIMTTACFDYLDPEEIDAFLNMTGSAQILEYLVSNYSFVTRFPGSPIRFQYHETFRASVQQLLHRTKTPGEVSCIHSEIGRFLVSRNEWVRGIHFQVLSGHIDRALQFALEKTEHLSDQECVDTIGRMFASVPESSVAMFPEIMLWVAMYLEKQKRISDSKRLLIRSIRAFQEKKLKRWAIKGFKNLISMLLVEYDVDMAKPLMEESLRYAGDMIDENRLYIELNYLTLFCETDCRNQVKRLFEEGLALKELVDRPDALALLWDGMAIIYYQEQGQFDLSTDLLFQSLAFYEKTGQYYQTAYSYLQVGVNYFKSRDYPNAVFYLQKSEEMNRMFEFTVLKIRILGILGLIYRRTNDEKRADDILNDLRNLLDNATNDGERKSSVYFVLLNEFEKSFLSGDIDNARRYAGNIESVLMDKKPVRNVVVAYIMMGELHIRAREYDRAKQILEESIKRCEQTGQMYLLTYSRFLMASLSVDGFARETRAHLEIALDLCRTYRMDYFLLNYPEFMRLIPFALKEKLATAYITELLDANPKIADTLKSRIANRYPVIHKLQPATGQPLQVKCFGEFVVTQGHTFSVRVEWAYPRIKNLFKFFVLNRKSRVSHSALVSAFWPDAAHENGMRKLYTSMTFLKRSLEPDLKPYKPSSYIVGTDQHYRLVLPAGSKIDFEDCDKSLLNARHCILHNKLSDAEKHFYFSMNRMVENFLPENLHESWVESTRTHLNVLLFNVGIKLSALFLKDGKVRKARDIALQLNQKDPLNEDAVLLLMRSHVAENHPGLAVSIYENTAKVLKSTLDVAPDPVLTMFYKDLIA
ncbi:hypothetical protein JXA80_09435 [bacterium]|nr:hypothetical protein [candidate division CSSED10-310 bacterium]